MTTSRIRTVLEMIKFEHTLFALPFALTSMLLAAGGWPEWRIVGWIVVAMVGARSAAMGFNRLIDRELDAANPRTATRALPAGLVTPGFVALFVAKLPLEDDLVGQNPEPVQEIRINRPAQNMDRGQRGPGRQWDTPSPAVSPGDHGRRGQQRKHGQKIERRDSRMEIGIDRARDDAAVREEKFVGR